jgi:hypothetical protein
VNYSSSSSFEFTTCDSYDWHGMTFTTSGVYAFDTTNVAGCDSLLTLNLKIKKSTSETMNVEACGSFTQNNQTWGKYWHEKNSFDVKKTVAGVYGDYPLDEGYLLEFDAFQIT